MMPEASAGRWHESCFMQARADSFLDLPNRKWPFQHAKDNLGRFDRDIRGNGAPLSYFMAAKTCRRHAGHHLNR
jgi:hypothetical protein